MKRRIHILTLVLLLVALPAAADVWTVTLNSGNTFLSRYEPQDANFSSDYVMFLSNTGNWMALAKSDISSIISDTESKGYGHVINTTTIALGWVPNDAPTLEEAAETTARLVEEARQADILGLGTSTPYSMPLVAEPDALGGFPLGFTRTSTPPIGFGTGSPTLGFEPVSENF